MSQQQHVVRQQTSMQQSSSSTMMQQSSVRQQTQTQTRVVREVQSGVQRVQGPTQMMPVGLPAGASPPVFEQIFQNARFAQGGDALFEGKVQGSPKPNVTWTRKGAQIVSGNKYQVTHDETTGKVTLLISAIGPGDEGEYTCTAANQYGEAICTVYIQPEAAYMMQQQRQQQMSQKTMMQQQQMSQQQFMQQQQHMMSMQTMESFRVDTFEYRLLHEVEFRNSLTMNLPGETEVDLGAIQGPPQAPQLQQKPRSTKVADGGNATFIVKVNGYPTPRVIWFKNGTRLQSSDKYLMTQSAGQVTLVVKNVTTMDNGYYTMLAMNSSGATVASAQLAVVPRGEITNGVPSPEVIRPDKEVLPEIDDSAADESSKNLEPKFIRGPTDKEVQEGKLVRFDARCSGRPYPEVAWFINGKLVADDETHKVLVNEAGNHSLMISKASLADAGTITCIAKNKSGEASFQCNLNVLEMQQMVSPKFVERFQQAGVNEGETVVLQCRAVGNPTPLLYWQKDGVSVENSPNVMVQSDNNGSSSLQILSASAVDAGWYQCNAQNAAGSTATRARLHVQVNKSAPAAPQKPHFPKPCKVIEPPPEPEPEIVILRPVERAHHVPKAPEEEHPTEPPKFTHPLRDIDIVEGTRAHFEAKVTPVGDATMNIEWLIDGKPLTASSRATVTYRFGFVALDILNVINGDTGVYTCRATNAKGMAETSANLRITERPLIESTSQHPEAMQQIQYLEQHKYQRSTSIEEHSTIKPTFVKVLSNLGEVIEGKYAHFEAQLHPVSDPFMRIEWFKDGKHITASSRINQIYNFGYVALNIMHLRTEDSGTYTVRATNKAGECTCQASISVISLASVTGDLGIPEQSQHIKSVEEMEAYRLMMLQKTSSEFSEADTAPLFKTQLKDATAREAGYAHFEARLEPVGDSALKVEWLKDGHPIEASSRITSFFNFGYVALTIKALILKDAGTYTCRAINKKGEAQVSCVLQVISKTETEVETSYEETVSKMQYLEDASRFQRTETEETSATTMPPKFLGPLKGTNKIVEGQKAHFEIRLEPQSDPTMCVEWYFNGQVIMSASRIKTYHDFGYVSLDIADVRQADAGQYTVVAKNALGQAQMSTVMTVETRSAIDTSSMHEVTLSKTSAMERRHREPQYDIEEVSKSKPEFTVLLQNPKPVPEGKNIHLEARLEPMNDPTMKVEWFFSGKPITIGSRFKTYFDFGFVALDVLGAYTTDSGEYTCRAENILGSAHTSASVQVIGSGGISSETMNEGAMEQIHYLEDASRHQRAVQDSAEFNDPPTFTKSLKNIETIEGTNIHLEARIKPVGDPSMRVEWFFNDGPLKVGHRFRPAFDFDYVALDLLSVYPMDSGIYTCRAFNRLGEAVTSASVKITESSGIIMESENQTLTKEQLLMLEDRSRYSRTEQVEETTKQAPVFTTSLKNIEVLEGQRAHFEVRLIPTADHTMKVEWFHNNVALKSGSRFMEYNDFGFVALDIMYAYAEDSGTYTCVATNCLGQAVTSCTLTCHTKESIISETMNKESMSKISMLESSSRMSRTVTTEETTIQAPVFTAPLKDKNVAENAPLHFEARLIPVGDPDLKVEWFKNNVPLQPANRISTMHDFGYVALDMKYVNPEDSGTYTCRATNRLGQAVTSATLVVSSKESLLMESQHSEALQKLRMLEDSSRYQKSTTEETVITQAPKFVVELSGLKELWEGQSAHMECRIEPYPDPSMKVEWFHNGQSLSIGHRFRTMYDFGFAALDILQAVSEDSGTYECRATNKLGTATSSITIQIKAKSDFIVETIHPEAMSKITRLEQKAPHRPQEEASLIEKPNFGRPLRNQERLIEGQSIHMEATLTPVNDPTMKVEWFFNGHPISVGHRFRTTYDFGFVALDILHAYPEDTGTYMCKATNQAGQAVTSCSIQVEGTKGLVSETMDEDRLRKIRQLEAMGQRPEEAKEDVYQKPVFTTPLNSVDNVAESQRVHLECRLEPINDPNLRVEWYVNGVEIKAGHRFRTTHDFGYVALDILYAYAEDSGNYLCKAINKLGEAVNSCSVQVSAHRNIYLDSQNPMGWEKIQNLEQRGRYERIEVSELPQMPPRFTSELRGAQMLAESQNAHLEGRIEPVHDPNMKIEWYHNGKALQSAARFHTTFDFGYVALDITTCYAEDSGEYTCRAVNKLGEATSSVSFKVDSKENIIYDSAHPEGLEKIKQLEGRGYGRQISEDVRTFQRPVFTQPLQNLDSLTEGELAHFECRLIPVGDPTLKVEWFRNEKQIETSSRINRTHDFGYVALDISGIRADDEGIYMCRAYNELGEAVTTASMKIKSHASIQLDTQHPEGMRKIQALEERKPTGRPDEGEKEYDKPVFTAALTGPAQIIEGQNAHYECRVVPIGDPSMRYEWYCSGVELKMGSRFKTTADFGYVTLDILQAVAEDSGVYMCKAINKAGEAVSSCTTRVVAKDSILGDALHPGWETIKLRETQWNRVPPTPMSPEALEPPMFTKHLESHERLQEAGNVRLEAQVQPAADPNLSIEWFKNGVQLATGTRIRSTFDFGHVTLEISGLRENDSGIYTCKAVNRVGEAVSTCNIKVFDRDWLIGDSVHPDALPKIARLEAPLTGPESPKDVVYDVPVFISHLNNVECREGETAHFECKVEPSKDPTMKIDWFINGKPMQAASRYAATYDFGFVSLDCTHCYAEDSGIYMCRATNSKGSASTTGTLKCLSKANLYFDTQHPQGRAGLEKVEEAERAYWAKYQRQMSEKEVSFPKPFFVRPLQTNFSLNENQALHMEANVEPKQDPDLKIEWFFNGKVLEQASRYKSSYDFGLVTLDLSDAYERDQGIYTCRAYNKAGEAFCTSTVVVGSKDVLIEDTQHPAGEAGLDAIYRMENNLRRGDRAIPDEEGHPPVFTVPFKDLTNIEEGEIAHFEAMLTPIGDQSMKVEFFFNGQPLKASYRVRTVYAFGMVVLEIIGTKISDSGVYTCRATNKWGTAECSVNFECVDRAHGQPPKFTTHIQNVEGLKDGDSAHFECTLIPIGDPNMTVEWFHNGEPLRNATRIKTVSDFGFVVLDIAYLQNHDAGEWLCKATNKYGSDTTKAYLNCFGMGGVYTDSLQPGSLDKIAQLEAHKAQKKGMLSPDAAEPPKFITQINNIEKLVEGQSAHFEARLKPVRDPNLNVEWFKDGKKLAIGHRYRTFHDFGIVILDILYCYEEDSGVYEARAVNKLGEDKTSATMKCFSKENLILSPQIPRGMEGGLDKIQSLEDSAWQRKDSTMSEKIGMAPKFTVPLNTIDSLKEGENAHFEARLVPTDDPRLKVEWYWNGKPMKYSSRIRQFCDFGFVIMEVSPIYPEDSGEYMCRAYNDYGEAVTKATLKCEGKRSIILESQLPKSMQRGMERIAELEGLMIKSPDMPTPTDAGQPPQFITQPKNVQILENQLAHFECRLLPVGDPYLRVDWFHNGRPLSAGSRIKTINDFGYVILEMANCYGRDSGTYTCRAVNKHGEATVECKLNVSSKSAIILEPQATGKYKDITESIQKLEDNMYKKETVAVEEEKSAPPRFVTELQDINDLVEGQPAHFDCRVEPVGDSTMRIEWFHNGMPLAAGSRVHMMDDFGFVVLDLEWTFSRDTGEYICRATNKWGQATTQAMLNVKSKQGVDLSTQLPQGMTAEKLKELERGPLSDAPKSVDPQLMAPKFVVPIKNQTMEEGEKAFFEAKVEPRSDPNLRIEWYKDGKPLQTGSRFRTMFEMGHVVLELLHTYAEDSGEYTCRAVNKLGQDLTRATLKSKAAQLVVIQSQVPKGMNTAQDFASQMEETLKKYCKEVMLTSEDIYDVEKRQPPRFVTHIKDVKDLKEMTECKFDCQLAPVGDPNMKVEWFFNGRPLPYKNRFTPIYDFGYVALIMNWVFGEDSGEYLCRATNKWGMDETRCSLKALGRPGVIYESQVPKGMQSLDKIRELEASWQIAPEAATEEEKVRCKPDVLKKPESLVVQEGDWARFSIRVAGHPKPRVMWLVNGSTASSGARFKIWYDGMFHLDIPKTRQYDNGKVEVICKNSLGESYATCDLTVNPRQDDYRAVLKSSPKQHTESSKSYRKPEWVSRMEDLKENLAGEKSEPKFTEEIRNSRVKEMDTITFTATFRGNPKPEISWYHNQKLIRQHASYQMRVRNNKAILTLVQCKPNMKGEYSCRAVNSEGETFTKANLEVIGLTYEEKLTIDDERYAAIHIQHAAEHMKEKERERALKERQKHEEAMAKMKDDKVERLALKQKEIEDAKKNVWKPKGGLFEEKKKVEKVYNTPKERRVSEMYANWTAPVSLEESYPSLQPNEFAPNQIPGVKCFVKVSETSMKGEEVVREVAPQYFDDVEIIEELATIHTMLKSNVKINEIWSMFRAGQFKSLQQPNIQSALVKICEHIGHQRNVSIILAQETQQQAVRHPVGLKAFLRMIKHAKNIKPDVLFKETIPKEMGKFSSTTQELTKVSELIRQGVQTEEIIASCEAGKLPTLKKPETQQPLVNIVEKHGHSVMVAQVLVEEAYRDAKDERVLAEQAWEVVHEEGLEYAKVEEVKTGQPAAPVTQKVETKQSTQIQQQQIEQHSQMTQQVSQMHTTQVIQQQTGYQQSTIHQPTIVQEQIIMEQPEMTQKATHIATSQKAQVFQESSSIQQSAVSQKTLVIQKEQVTEHKQKQETVADVSTTITKEKARVGQETRDAQKTAVQKKTLVMQKEQVQEHPQYQETIEEGAKMIAKEKARVGQETTDAQKTAMSQKTLVMQKEQIMEHPQYQDTVEEGARTIPKEKARLGQETTAAQKTAVSSKMLVMQKEQVMEQPQHQETVTDVKTTLHTEKARVGQETKNAQKTAVSKKTLVMQKEQLVEQPQYQEKVSDVTTSLATEKARVGQETTDAQKTAVSSKTLVMQKEQVMEQQQHPETVGDVSSTFHTEKARVGEETRSAQKTAVSKKTIVMQKEQITEQQQHQESVGNVSMTLTTEKARVSQETRDSQKTAVSQKPVVMQKEMVTEQKHQPESTQDVKMTMMTEQARMQQEPNVFQKTTITQHPTVAGSYEEQIQFEPTMQTVVQQKMQPIQDQRVLVQENVFAKSQQQQVQTMQHQQQVTQQQTIVHQQQSTQQMTQQVQQKQQFTQQVQQTQQVTVQKKTKQTQQHQQQVIQTQQTIQQEKSVKAPQLPQVDKAQITSVERNLQSAAVSQVEVRACEIAPPLDSKIGDELRAVATYVADDSQENAMHLVEGERVYIQECTNSDWWFVKKNLTLEQGYVPRQLLAEEVSYTHYVQQKLNEKIVKLPVFDKLKKGQKVDQPKVTQLQPVVKVKDGQEIQFVVKIQGTPRPNVTWFRQTAIIKPSDEFQIFYSDDNTATLVIKEVFPEDAGMFTCCAKNETGHTSTSTELVVEGPISDHGSSLGASRRSLSRESSMCDIMEGIPPTFANKSSVKNAEEGATVEMDVRLVAIPEPEIVWKRNDQVLKESSRIKIVRQKDVHAYRSIYIIKGAKKDDEGVYEIYVKNREGEAKTTINLKVTAPQAPVFEEKFSDQSVETEGTIRLVARIKGVPVPDLSWSRDGKKLKMEKNVVMTYTDDLAVLEIQKAKTKEDSGKYTCTATNKVGKATHSAKVSVGADVVTFKRGLETCAVEEGHEVILECRTSKEKECKWYKGKNEVKKTKNVTIEQDGLTHRLTIKHAKSSDSGKYKCQFDNTSTTCTLTVKCTDDFAERIADVEVQEKEMAIMQVQVSHERAQVTWHKDGEEIVNSDRIELKCESKTRKLIIKETHLADEGEYTCVLGDQECTAELTIRELPAEIVRKMKDQVVSKGQKACMEVELTKGDAVITWYKENKEIRFSDHYQLSIDGKVQRLLVYNCNAEDAGTYHAKVGNSKCSASLVVELQAEGGFITKLPSQMDVNFQSDATFTVEISKEFEVKWFRNHEEIKADQRYIVKKEKLKRTLIVKNVNQADSAEYSCVLANLKTTCKMNVVLMMTAPKIAKEFQKQEVVVTKGKDVTLKVPFIATPKPKSFWYHKNQLLDPENNKNKYLATITENEASITVKTVENIDCGEYRLKLCNDCGAAYADYTVKILDKPSKPGSPEAMKVTNDSVTLHWSAPKEDGGRVITNYIIEYMCKKENKWQVFNKTEKITQTTTIVTKLTKNEEYCFRVSAVNEIGTSTLSDMTDFVKVCQPTKAVAPVVKEQLEAIVTGLHQKIVLRCVVTSVPAPKIEWLKDNKMIKGETRYENFTATFTIKDTREDTGGMYTCRASNEAGMAECSATVVIQEAPRFEFDDSKQCQTLSVGDKWHVPIQVIGYPKPKISWTRNEKNLTSTPHIVIHTDENEGITDIAIQKLALEDTAVYTLTATNSAGKAQLSFNLRVLEEEKEYQVCALEVIEEEVKRERPSRPLGPLMVTDVSTSTVNLNWKTPSSDGGMQITSFYIEKQEKGQKQWQKVADVSADCRSYTVSELVEGHEYFFRVFALNAVGISDALEVKETVLIKSLYDKPGQPIGPFDVSNMTESSMVISWEAPETDGGSPITHYVFEKREINKKAWSKVEQTAANVTTIEVTGLKKGTAYNFRVYAVNAIGQGPALQPDEPITAGKKITPPSKPNSLQILDVTSKTVTLAWAPPTTTGGADLIGYVIERRLVSEKKWERINTVDASVTLYCIENLKEKCEYEFRVYAENPVGLSEEAAMTEQVRLKTHAVPPSPPTAPLEVRPTGPTSLMIEWGAPESDGGAPLLGYIIAIRDIKRTMWIEVGQVGANFTRLHIKELQEEHEYFVRVFARNEVGSSDPLEIDEPVKIIRPADFTEYPEDDNAPSLSYSTTETLSWMREAGMDADIYSYARGRLLNRDEYFFKVWHRSDKSDDRK